MQLCADIRDRLTSDEFLHFYEERKRFFQEKGEKILDEQIGEGREIFRNAHMVSKSSFLGGLESLLNHPEDWRRDNHTPTFMDLGCSIGWVTAVAASYGWRTLGVEIDKGCAEAAKRTILNAQAEGLITQPDLATIIHGNFYPEGFDMGRLIEDPRKDPYQSELQQGKILEPGDPVNYSQHGFNLAEVDIFYHFQVEPTSRLLSFFNQYASRGSLFYLVAGMGEWDLKKIPDGISRLELSAKEFKEMAIEVFQKN